MRFDASSRTFEVSVRELAEDAGFRPIGADRGEGWGRFGVGTEIHSRVLAARTLANTDYRREVHLSARVPINNWTAVVTGRLDGCAPEAGGTWRIEEFKSLHFAAGEVRSSGPSFERHRRQLLLYCHLWHLLENTPVSGSLVYVDIATGDERAFHLAYDFQAQSAVLGERLDQLVAGWEAGERERQRKAAAGAALPFPHEAPRPGQQQLMEAVRQALRQGQCLMAEAPTGSGKTAAALHPALAHGLGAGKQVVFLTSKTLQQKMAVSALSAMNASGAFRTIQIRAKQRMCANEQVLCHEDFCPYAKDYPEKMTRSGILDRLRSSQPHHDPDAVFAEAKKEQVCPFEVQLELAARADAVVADYNYVFEPGVALRHLSGEELQQALLLVDEAHNLPDRARQIFSPDLTEKQFADADGWLLFQQGKLFDEMRDVVSLGACMLRDSAANLNEPEPVAQIDPPRDAMTELWRRWEPQFVSYMIWKRERKLFFEHDPIVDLHFALHRFRAVLTLFGNGFAAVVERRDDGIRLGIVCLDPSRPLAPVFESAAATVLLSATLSPASWTRRALGLPEERTATLSVPPPFPRENRRILIAPQVQTTYTARSRHYGAIAQMIAGMADAHTGNTLALFPSYRFLEEVSRLLPAVCGRLVVQRPNLTDAERREILRALEGNGVLLLAVLGGMYAEGVDYPGERLSCVAIVSPALPQVSFERELLRRYFDEQDDAGFEYAYLNPGLTRVVQAAGRLIRSETDRGVIALLCRRFLQDPYASRLPRDWYERSPSELITRNPAADVRAFFSSRAEHAAMAAPRPDC